MIKTSEQIKVKQFTNSNGNEVKNQFIIYTPKGQYFQSYSSVIVFIPFDPTEKIQLDQTYWNYSQTTSKYRNQFLGETKKETEKKINNGTYLLKDLN